MEEKRKRAIELNNAGALKHMDGKYGEAIDLFTRAYEEDPSFSEAIESRASAYNNAGRFDDAIADFTNLLSLDSGNVTALARRAQANIQLHQYQPALDDLNEALRIDPDCAAAHEAKGIYYERVNDYPRAFHHYDLSISLEPTNNGQPHYNRGLARARQQDYEGALEDLNAAIERNPNFVEALNNRGNLYIALGDVTNAKADFTTAIEISPWHAKAHFNLGLVHYRLDEHQDALTSLNKAAELGHHQAAEAVREIRAALNNT